MSQFEYLSVLVSIIIGLGLSHLLASAARLIQMRSRVRFHAPTLLWMALLFLLQVQIWWAAFGDRGEEVWNFFDFLSFLLIPVLAYLLTYLLVPELEGEATADLEASYHRNRGWFFGLLALAVAVSLGRDLLDDGVAALGLDALFRAFFLALALASAATARRSWHLVGAVAALAGFCGYIVLLFLRLQ